MIFARRAGRGRDTADGIPDARQAELSATRRDAPAE